MLCHNTISPTPILDEWIRRRVRMCYIKQWPKPRTRIRNLINLGSPKDQAIGVGLSSKGYWRPARTFASQCGLTNTYLKEQGLLSVKDLWCAYHYPGTRQQYHHVELIDFYAA